MNREFRIFKENIKELSKRIYKWFKSPVFRVHILKIVAIALSVMLLVSTYMVHITYAGDFIAFREITTTANLSRDVPRGVVHDRYLLPLIANESISVITYRHVPNTPTSEMRRVARELAQLIELRDDEPSYHQILPIWAQRDLFVLLYPEEARALVPAEEARGLSNADFNALMIQRIEAEHLERLTDEEMRIHAIFIRMYQGAGRTTNIIKENPSEEEIARVTENLVSLPGIDIGMDWNREYPSDMSWHFFGNVSSHQQGIPRDRALYFLSQGYAANARVGTSQLERSLQSYLSGFQYRYFIDDGNDDQLSAGLSGFQVSLTIDSELQLILEELVVELLSHSIETERTAQNAQSAYLVMQNPNTGEVLAMVGIRLDQDEYNNVVVIHDPLGTIHRAYAMGSAIKGATLMAGYDFGATTIGQTRYDTPINVQGSNPFRSVYRMRTVDDVAAISRSSNVFFFRQTMALAGVSHTQGGPIRGWNADSSAAAWDFYRSYFNQVGLGVRTGIELQDEAIGQRVRDQSFSELMHFSVGQADTYTTMQLAQFTSIIATRGYRFQTHMIRNIYMPGYNLEERQLVRAFEPNLLNYIELTDAQWDNIHEGHRQTTHIWNATGFSAFNDRPSPRPSGEPRSTRNPTRIAGKTGTAEVDAQNLDGSPRLDRNGRNIRVTNRIFMGYAPYNNPEVVVAVIVPQSQTYTFGTSQLVNYIARDAVEAYFELQLERASR